MAGAWHSSLEGSCSHCCAPPGGLVLKPGVVTRRLWTLCGRVSVGPGHVSEAGRGGSATSCPVWVVTPSCTPVGAEPLGLPLWGTLGRRCNPTFLTSLTCACGEPQSPQSAVPRGPPPGLLGFLLVPVSLHPLAEALGLAVFRATLFCCGTLRGHSLVRGWGHFSRCPLPGLRAARHRAPRERPRRAWW